MKLVKIKSISEGMVTAAEVKDRTGRTLLEKGKAITKKHLKVFKTWGITEVKVVLQKDSSIDQSVEENETPIDPEIIKEADELFKFTDRRHPIVSEFYNLCLSRKVKLMNDNT